MPPMVQGVSHAGTLASSDKQTIFSLSIPHPVAIKARERERGMVRGVSLALCSVCPSTGIDDLALNARLKGLTHEAKSSGPDKLLRPLNTL